MDNNKCKEGDANDDMPEEYIWDEDGNTGSSEEDSGSEWEADEEPSCESEDECDEIEDEEERNSSGTEFQ